MVMAECAQSGLIILSKLAMSDGISALVFVLYSNTIAAVVLLPVSFLVHRSSSRPLLTFSVLCGFFMLGVLGMERLDTRGTYTVAKSVGTVVSIAGAFVVTLYKGPSILGSYLTSNMSMELLATQESNWVLGGCLLFVDCMMAASWLILQALILRKYSAGLVIVFFYCFFVAIQSAVICFIVETDSEKWSLHSSIRLYSVIYSGVFGSAFQVGVGTWCLHSSPNRACFCCNVQALGDCYDSSHRGHIFGGDVLSRKFDRIDCNSYRFLLGYVGQRQRRNGVNQWHGNFYIKYSKGSISAN